MKRSLLTLAFTLTAAPAFAAGLPFEQTQLDRALPALAAPAIDNAAAGATAAAVDRSPFEQTQFDRRLPNVAERPALDDGRARTFEQFISA